MYGWGCGRMTTPVDNVLHRLNRVTKKRDGWEGQCPCHNDQKNSLCIDVTDDGKVLVYCQAGCKTTDVVAAIGLMMSDLYPEGDNGGPQIIATYDYRDERKQLLYQAVRFKPKDFRQRRPDGNGEWVWKMRGVRRVLYGLPELLAADSQQTVFIPEGEKDVDRLRSLGLVAVCNVGGAGKWKEDYNGPLAGRRVIIIPDCDDAGRKHAEEVARSLSDVTESVRILLLPELSEKGDVSDWLDAGGTKDELLRLAENAQSKYSRPISRPSTNISIQSPEGRTETANGRRFAQQNGTNVRFCHPWGKWIGWDGKRWKQDDTAAMERLAKRVADQIWKEAQLSDSDTARKFAAKSASSAGIRAMLALAASEPEIPILPDALDNDPWLLNVQNGTVNLKTGKLREHRREDFITKICPVAFNPEATSYEWDRFLDGIFDGDAALISFVQRLLGYALSGDVREQILPIFWGGGSNGKTTLLNAFMDVVGSDYSIKLGRDFLVTKRQEGHATERMDLFGKRLAVCSETDDGRRLSEGLVKELCGGDVIRGRRMREDSWEYQPTHKIILATNAKPNVKGTDHAIWRRLALVPFNVQFWNPDKVDSEPEHLKQDKQLPEKLKAESEGILAWAVQGCLDWQRQGLGDPPAVKTATDKYRAEQDLVGTFINERCTVNELCKARSKDLFQEYERWADETGEPLIKQRSFGKALTERGFTRFTNNGTWYRGIGLTDGTTE